MNFWNTLLTKLSRVTSSGNFIPEIDGLRFLSLYYIMIYHVETSMYRDSYAGFDYESTGLYHWIHNGHNAVPLFFTISGFILALPFLLWHVYNKREIKLKKYYSRRLTRLEPPYILAMTLIYLLFSFSTTYPLSEYLTRFFHSITYTHAFAYGFQDVINPVAWTLEVEVQFYLLAPLLFLIFKLKNIPRRLVLILLILASALFNDYSNGFIPNIEKYRFKLYLLGQLQYFGVGMLFADLYLQYKEKLQNHVFYDLLALLALTSFFILNLRMYELSIVLFLLFLGVFKSIYVRKVFSIKVITVLGGMCYSAYMLHLPIVQIITNNIGKHFSTSNYYIDLLMYNVVSISAVIIVSSIYFYYIEKPFMNPNWWSEFKLKFLKS